MIGNSWDNKLSEEYRKEYFTELMNFVKDEYEKKTIYPKKNEVFNAFRYTDFDNVKVVILGQDPYHGVGEAHGLSFSVQDGTPKPPSLKNIFKELNNDLGYAEPISGDLTSWAKQGVLLLNSVLTVEKDKAASHKDLGWNLLTDHIIKLINMKQTPVVFILWGNFARSKKAFITNKKHLIIESTHPSPFSAYNGFFGSKPFSRTNNFLKQNNIPEINWDLNKKN